MDGAPGTARHDPQTGSARSRWMVVAASVAATGLILAGVLVAFHQPWATRTSLSDPVVTGTGALPGSGSAGCVEAYSPQTLVGRDFAFEGVVTRVDPTAFGGGHLVTFQVARWFRPDGPGEFEIALPSTDAGPDYSTPAYTVGTRLLVSGEPRWGGAPLDRPVVWTCGFTRYADAATVQEWQTAFG